MDNNKYIQDELLSLSPMIAGLVKVNVFFTPLGYFENLSANIEETGFMDDIARFNPAANVPDGYFKDLSERVLQKIKMEAIGEDATFHPLLHQPINNNIFDVPNDYFNQLSSSIVEKINSSQQHAPLLASLKKSNLFETPVGYFDTLPAKIVAKIQKPTAKLIDISFYRSVMKYVAAAVVIGFVSMIVLKFTTKPDSTKSSAVAAVADESIEKGKKMDDQKFNETLNNLSEDEIANYLVRNGSEADVALLTSSIDEKALPSQEDYITDEKTLENLLLEIDNKNMNN